jgi:outer membrane receptor for ferrienterochelin and colicins
MESTVKIKREQYVPGPFIKAVTRRTSVRILPKVAAASLLGLRSQRCFLLCLLLTLSTAGLAEDNTESFAEMSLDELMTLDVFTAASRIPTQQAHAPGTVYSFNRDDFDRMGVRRVDELLHFVPGMQLTQYRKRHQSIWSRGLLDRYNDKLILIVDGVQLRHLYYGHFSLGDNFPLEKIEKVEIIQGPASSLYGANAFGGIISITTRAFADSARAELTAEAGNHERKKFTGLANSNELQVFGSWLDQDAPFRDDRKSFIGGDTLQPLDETYRNLFVKGQLTEGLTLSLDYYRNETPFLFIPDTQDAFIDEEMLTLSARHEIGDIEHGKLESTLYYTQDNAEETEFEQQTGALGYRENQDATMAGLTVTAFKRLFEQHVFALGVSWQREQAEDMDYVRHFRYDLGFIDPPLTGSLLSEPGIVTDDYAVFIQDVWTVSSELDITLGARYDYFDQFGEQSNYRAAFVYTPRVNQTWKLLYGTSIRTPSYREYLKVLEGSFQAPVPDPERLSSLELAYLHRWQHANISITLFHNEAKDFIREVPTPDGADEYFANSDETLCTQGVDSLLNINLNEDLLLRLNVSYIDAEAIESASTPYIASWLAGLNLSYAYLDQHNAGFSVVYNSDRSDTNSYSEDDPGEFTLISVFASGSVSRDLSYSLGLNNLLDERVYDPAADFGSQYNTEKSEREFWARLKWMTQL